MRALLNWICAMLLGFGAVASGATINFSGYTWTVRPSGRGGPGPNNWEAGNVSVDTNGYLHLRLTQREGKWYGCEVYTPDRLGFGLYEFWVTGPLDRLDKNVVVGLFNYPTREVGPDGTHEIDIEFARWGTSAAPTGNYTVWPTTNGPRRETKEFAFLLSRDLTKHSFSWTPSNVLFASHEEMGAHRSRQLVSWVFEPTNALTSISQKPMPVHMNIWCFKGQPPSNGDEVELVVRAFKFTPL